MLKLILGGLCVLMAAGPVYAHEVWLENDGTGPVRVFLGEAHEPMPQGGDPEFPKLKTPLVFTSDRTAPARLIRRADHIDAVVSTPGDVRLLDPDVFDPQKLDNGNYKGRVFYARAGRVETRALLDLEIVPVSPNSDRFRVVFRGKAVPRAAVTVINPDRWVKAMQTDEDGVLAAPISLKGRYLLMVNLPVDEHAVLAGREVTRVNHVSTLTFVAP